jgi:hypothetical protein
MQGNTILLYAFPFGDLGKGPDPLLDMTLDTNRGHVRCGLIPVRLLQYNVVVTVVGPGWMLSSAVLSAAVFVWAVLEQLVVDVSSNGDSVQPVGSWRR